MKYDINTLLCPIKQLFVAPTESDLKVVIEEAVGLVKHCPEILVKIDSDLDAHGLAKRNTREADAAWAREQNGGFEGFDGPKAEPTVAATLGQGRTRTSAFVVLLGTMLRGYFGSGFKDHFVESQMMDSEVLRILFHNLGEPMPRPSTLTELVNAISLETHQFILDAQVTQALAMKWDDFKTVAQDSTHVKGNTAWPTESGLIVSLVGRMVRTILALVKFQMPLLDLSVLRSLLDTMAKSSKAISLAGKGKNADKIRIREYEKLLRSAISAKAQLTAFVQTLQAALIALQISPSRLQMAQRAMAQIVLDLQSLQSVIDTCYARVFQKKSVASKDKVLSHSDPDAAMIVKGQRLPVVGYKPQISRSKNGFVISILLPQGNAADSQQMLPMINEVVARTKIIPQVFTGDDGYSSEKNLAGAKLLGIETVSINGAKGKKLTDEADWNSNAYAAARNDRSAVESLMFTLKQGYGFGAVARRGLVCVYAELLGKAIAYNLCRSNLLRTRQNRAQEILLMRQERDRRAAAAQRLAA